MRAQVTINKLIEFPVQALLGHAFFVHEHKEYTGDCEGTDEGFRVEQPPR